MHKKNENFLLVEISYINVILYYIAINNPNLELIL